MFSWNQVFCLKNWKLWRAPTTIEFNKLSWNFAHVSYLPMSRKRCSGFVLFCICLDLFAKIREKPCFYILTETRFSITQDLNKIKKSRTLFSRYCWVGNVCKLSVNSVELDLNKIFNFLDKWPGSLEIIELCINLKIGFCIT